MSKVYEAIQRLENDSHEPLPGVSVEAKDALKKAVEQAATHSSSESEASASNSPEASVAEDPIPAGGRGSKAAVSAGDAKRFRIDEIAPEYVNLRPESRLFYYSQPDSPGADRFRLLRMRLTPLWEAGKLKTLFVTSSHAQDGKSTVVLNLATALAEQGKRNVLVVEGDLCHPGLSSKLGIAERSGLAECLESGADPLPLIRRLDPLGWHLLPAGRTRENSTELLQVPRLGEIFEQLRALYDWVVIDTPPILPLTDTLTLRRHADAGLLVVRADRTPEEAVERAIASIGSKNLLGLLLNGSVELDRLYSDYRHSYGRRKSTQD